MSSAGNVLLAETVVEARRTGRDETRLLRPLPVHCPLPRRSFDPRVKAVGWLAGRQSDIGGVLVVTTTWCVIRTETPAAVVSNPLLALELTRLPADDGVLWSLSRRRAFDDWLRRAFLSERRFASSLDLGAINERRAATSAAPRWGGSIYPRPVFGRACFDVDTDHDDVRSASSVLGAFDDQYVLLWGARRDGGTPVAYTVEAEVLRCWMSENSDHVEDRDALEAAIAKREERSSGGTD